MAVYMKKLLQTLVVSRSAGFKASWKGAGEAWEVQPGSCPLSLLDGTGAAIQPRPPSLPGHRDLAAGCFEIHVWINLVFQRLVRLFIYVANLFQNKVLWGEYGLKNLHVGVSAGHKDPQRITVFVCYWVIVMPLAIWLICSNTPTQFPLIKQAHMYIAKARTVTYKWTHQL